MIVQVILEGLGLGILLILVCATVSARARLAWCIFIAPKFRTGA